MYLYYVFIVFICVGWNNEILTTKSVTFPRQTRDAMMMMLEKSRISYEQDTVSKKQKDQNNTLLARNSAQTACLKNVPCDKRSHSNSKYKVRTCITR